MPLQVKFKILLCPPPLEPPLVPPQTYQTYAKKTLHANTLLCRGGTGKTFHDTEKKNRKEKHFSFSDWEPSDKSSIIDCFYLLDPRQLITDPQQFIPDAQQLTRDMLQLDSLLITLRISHRLCQETREQILCLLTSCVGRRFLERDLKHATATANVLGQSNPWLCHESRTDV